MQVAIVCSTRSLNANYRARVPLGELERRGRIRCSLHDPNSPEFRIAALTAADVVVVHRYANDQMRNVLRGLRDRGIAVVWDNDDDTSAIPRSNPLYRRHGGAGGQRIARDVQRVVQIADVVTTPSEHLAAQYRTAGAHDVRVLENYLPEFFPRVKPRSHDGVVLVWTAALEHQGDHQQLRLRETFGRLLDAHPELRILSLGLGLGLSSPRYEHVPFVPFPQLAETLAGADVGIAPLTDIPWNRARSNVKLKEYGAAGLTWLASPVGAYRALGEKQGGRLVGDDAWGAEISRLVVDARTRKKLGGKAHKWAKGETIDRHAGLWEQALRDAVAAARAQPLARSA